MEDDYKIIKYDGIWLDMNEPSNLHVNKKIPGEIFKDEEEQLKYEDIANKKI